MKSEEGQESSLSSPVKSSCKPSKEEEEVLTEKKYISRNSHLQQLVSQNSVPLQEIANLTSFLTKISGSTHNQANMDHEKVIS